MNRQEKLRVAVCLSALLLVLSARASTAAEVGGGPSYPLMDESQLSTTSIRVDVDDKAMFNIVPILRNDYGVRLYFEDQPYDYYTDNIKLQDELADLEARKAQEKLSPSEERRLANAIWERDNGTPPNMPVRRKTYRFSGMLDKPTVEEFLDALTEGSPFKWTQSNGAFYIYPREGSLLSFPVSAVLHSVTLGDAIDQILAQSTGPVINGPSAWDKFGIRASIGPVPRGKEPALLAPLHKSLSVSQLVLENIAARGALARVFEATGAKIVWDLKQIGNGGWYVAVVNMPDESSVELIKARAAAAAPLLQPTTK